MEKNNFIWKIDPSTHRCRGTWIIRVLTSNYLKLEFYLIFHTHSWINTSICYQILQGFPTLVQKNSNRVTLVGTLVIFLCESLSEYTLFWWALPRWNFPGGVYRPSASHPMCLCTDLCWNRVLNSTVLYYYLLDSILNDSALCSGNTNTESKLCCRNSLPVRPSCNIHLSKH